MPDDIDSFSVIVPNAHAANQMLDDYSYFYAMEGMLNFDDSNNVDNIPISEKLKEVEVSILMQTVIEGITTKAANETLVQCLTGCDLLGDDL